MIHTAASFWSITSMMHHHMHIYDPYKFGFTVTNVGLINMGSSRLPVDLLAKQKMFNCYSIKNYSYFSHICTIHARYLFESNMTCIIPWSLHEPINMTASKYLMSFIFLKMQHLKADWHRIRCINFIHATLNYEGDYDLNRHKNWDAEVYTMPDIIYRLHTPSSLYILNGLCMYIPFSIVSTWLR